MALRLLPTKNVKLIKELDKEVFPADDAPDTDGHVWWVLRDGRKAIAFAGAKYVEAENVVYLSRAGVLHDYRGRHLQRRLIRARVRWAKKLGVKQIITYTLPGNPSSGNNLMACGFKLYLPEWKWGGKNALYWVKFL